MRLVVHSTKLDHPVVYEEVDEYDFENEAAYLVIKSYINGHLETVALFPDHSISHVDIENHSPTKAAEEVKKKEEQLKQSANQQYQNLFRQQTEMERERAYQMEKKLIEMQKSAYDQNISTYFVDPLAKKKKW
jgi:hypothetical protein